MEEQSSTSSKKWLIIAAVIVTALLLIVVIFLFLNRSTQNETTLIPEEIGKPTTSVFVSPTIAQLNEFSNAQFSLSYPAGFSASEGVLPDGGTSTTLLSADEKILIETFNSQTIPASKIIKDFTGMGYSESPVSLGFTNATVISGTRYGAFAQKGYVFEANGRTYKIIFSYASPKQDSAREQIFDSIMSTFSLR